MNRILSRNWRIYGVFLAIAAVFLLPVLLHLGEVPFQPGATYSDLLISHLANSLFINHALHEWGQIPLWNPTILSGMPLAADPLSGFWYAPNWLAHLWPSPTAYNCLSWLHLAWLGLGMFLLARSEGHGHLPALLAGTAGAGMPKLVAHIGLGHVSLVFSVCWTPWLLLAIRRAVARLGGPRRAALRWGVASGALLGVIGLADPRWAPFAALIGAAYGLWHLRPWANRPLASLGAALTLLLSGLVASLGVSSALALPLLELTRLSTRANLLPGERTVFALPAAKVFGLFLPDLGGYAEYQIYAGVAVLILAAFAVAVNPRRVLFWAASAIGALLFALGDATPLYGWVSGLIPGFDLLRVPSRSLFLVGFCLAFMAGEGLEVWMRRAWTSVSAKRGRLTITSLTFFLFLLALGTGWLLPPGDQKRALITMYVPVLALSTTGILLAGMGGWRTRPGLLGAAILLLSLLDLGWVDSSAIEMRPRDSRLSDLEGAFSRCHLTEHSRMLSPSYSIPQATAAGQGLQIADGVNPLQLSSYWDYMSRAMGFSANMYSVTLPPFLDGDPNRIWAPDIDVASLARLNISCVVSAYPFHGPGLTQIYSRPGLYVSKLDETRGRAWVVQTLGEGGPYRPVDSIDWSPNRIHIVAQGPGRLVLSEIDYPGWVARLDGHKVDIEPVFGLLRSMELPGGSHVIELTFLPSTVFLGAALSLVAALTTLWVWIGR